MTAYTREKLLRDWSAALDRAVEQELGMKFPDRRERIATAVLAGFMSSNAEFLRDRPPNFVGASVALADALIAELDKPKEVQP